MLAVLTGPARSGKSTYGLRLALASGRPVVVAVGGMSDDQEMVRRIARHRAERPGDILVVETARPDWTDDVPAQACLLVDCLGTVLGPQVWDLVDPDAELVSEVAESAADAAAENLVAWLSRREGDTVVVTNEVGWGIVPATPAGRLFRDVLGRANRRLVDAADAAWLVIAGRCLDIATLEREVGWPHR